MQYIPFNRSTLQGSELDYIRQAIATGEVAGDHGFSRKCQALLERELDVPKALVTTSCTHALEMAALLLNVGVGDEVIVPSFTFVSTANAFTLRGGTPRFIDVRPDTLNLDEELLEGMVTNRTKAIVPVHYAGVGCEMDRIMKVADRNGVSVVEDNAHGLFGRYRGRKLGTFGRLSTQSFHETKNITCGEGGALLINDADLVQRAEIIREKGTDRSRFFRGEVNKYSWVDLGSSYVMSDVLAAFLFGQLEKYREIQERRERLWRRYDDALRVHCLEHGIQPPTIPDHCDPAWHMYYVILPSLEARSAMIDHLKRRQIAAVFHYLPLHLADYALRWGGRRGDCPVAERVADCLLRLPFYSDMTVEDQDRVIEAFCEFQL